MFLIESHCQCLCICMKSVLIAVMTCAVVFYIRFLWAIQDDLRHRRKNRADTREASHCGPLLKVNIADVLTLRRSDAAPSRARSLEER